MKKIKKEPKVDLGGRPTYKPTSKDRLQAEKLSQHGITHDEIAILLGVAKKTLYKHFRKELDRPMPALHPTA